MLRQHFLTADMGISGGNFFVAETGSVVIVTNEGNGRMVTTLPRVHVAITGIEKVIADAGGRRDADAPAAALGHRPVDLELRRRPHRTAAQRATRDGPEHMYFILVDGGRTGLLGGDMQRDAALHPLRRLHEPLPGLPERRRPRLRLGVSRADRLDPHADVRRARERARPAARGDAVQPVRRRLPGARFPLPDLLRKLREKQVERHLRPAREMAALRAWAWVAQRPWAYAFATRWAARALRLLGGRTGRIRKLPGARGWTLGRDFPAPQRATFRDQYKRSKK